MRSAHLYCQPACAICQSLAHQLGESGIEVVVSDITEDLDALDAVIGVGYHSLPVLVGSDGTSAAGEAAVDLVARLSRRMPKFVDANIPSGPFNDRRELS